MAKFTPNAITSTYSAIDPLNANFDEIATLLEQCVFRDGTSPNAMNSVLDMNHFKISNLASPVNTNDAVRLADLSTILSGSIPTLALVDYTSSLDNAVERTLQAKLDEFVHVRDFGATGFYGQDATAYVQAAIDACPEGGTVIFGHGMDQGGDYKVTSTITITKHVNLMGFNSRIVGLMGNNTTDLIVYAPAAEVRNVTIRGLRLGFNSGGRHALSIGNGSIGFLHGIIENCNIGGGLGGFGLVLEGTGVLFNTIRNNYIAGTAFASDNSKGAIKLACADGTIVTGNLIAQLGCGILVNLVNGSFKTEIKANGIVSRDIGVCITAGQQVDIENNQFEQATGNTGTDVNQATNASHIVLSGGAYPSSEEIRDIRIIGNNFGSASNQVSAITLVANTFDIKIEDNYFANIGTSGYDIRILAASCKYTRTGKFNRVGGIRATINRGDSNTVDPKTLFFVSDSGTGTYGFAARKVPTLGAGWTGTADFCIWKDEDDHLHFEGNLSVDATGAHAAGGYTVFTAPVGMRPASACVLCLPNDINTIPSQMVLNIDGLVTVGVGVNVSSTLFFGSSASPLVRGRTSYLSGPY